MITLDNIALDLLRKVQRQTSPALYTPEKGDLAGFQPKAERLMFLADVGFIDLSFAPSRENKTGNRYVDCVVVRNITARGQRALAEAVTA